MTDLPPPPTLHHGPPPEGQAVAIGGLYKSFGTKVAVNGLDLAVPKGTFFGLVGPNGAGKSTTLKISTGLLRPDRGEVWVAGRNVWDDPRAVKSSIGVVPEDLRLFERLTGQELLEYVGLLRGFERAVCRRRASELLEVMDLADAAGRLVLDYSTGMRKKIALGAAILHRPSVLFLDEPFESVDPLSVRTLREILSQLVGNGATVVFSSHVMEVVERLCDHVAVMHAGSVVASGPTAEVCAGRRLEDVFAEAVGHQRVATTLDWL
ncbi:MAG: ABC transporter ATP-binding protein [Acidimicrobiales bacterium]|nr:ABC transporter ATP-binding protein [Acidimicrobiales bacterium]